MTYRVFFPNPFCPYRLLATIALFCCLYHHCYHCSPSSHNLLPLLFVHYTHALIVHHTNVVAICCHCHFIVTIVAPNIAIPFLCHPMPNASSLELCLPSPHAPTSPHTQVLPHATNPSHVACINSMKVEVLLHVATCLHYFVFYDLNFVYHHFTY